MIDDSISQRVVWVSQQQLSRQQLPTATDQAGTGRPVTGQPVTGRYVLCWLHHALRVRHNATLEAANAYARQLNIPLLIYAGLGGAHRYNSDRSHRFILESAQDLHRQLTAARQRLWFNLPQQPASQGPLAELAASAALIVSELFPAAPFPGWYRQLNRRVPGMPFVLVDDRCLIPMTTLTAAPTRAFRFRTSIRKLLDNRLNTDPDQADPIEFAPPPRLSDLPGEWQPLDWETVDIADCIAACDIEHGIAPVAHTPGGSTAAQQRWQAFRDNGGLRHYARRRNDAALDGVSRLSPYLHFGCLSALQVAREAHQLRCVQGMRGGVDKFLDELIIWRELAHHFCYHRQDDLDSLAALPGWARDTLQEHQSETGELTTLSKLDLEQANSPHALWNAAQQSLLSQGELHNNVRMSWGKGIVQWSPDPAKALQRLLDLNHRYALDGCDPNSYGGLLWCLGQFDRPFPPPRPRLGSIRPRSLDRHMQRLDMAAYQAQVRRPADGQIRHTVVIGAGLSGLVAAWHLQQQGQGQRVTVLEKARGAGGRMSTRRTDQGHFDHGAQYFTARDPRFRRWVDLFAEHGLVREWSSPIGVFDDHWQAARPGTSRYVARPGMNAICKHYARQLDVHYQQRVTAIHRTEAGWYLTTDADTHFDADQLVLSVPPEQALELLPESLSKWRQVLADIRMQPCWAVMLSGQLELPDSYQAAFINTGPLSWIANNHNKPGRDQDHTVILHANPEWSNRHLEDAPESVAEQLLQACLALPECQLRAPEIISAHRWRYALAQQPLQHGALWDAAHQIGLCGDWCNGSRVEGAFLSGQKLVALSRCGQDLTTARSHTLN